MKKDTSNNSPKYEKHNLFRTRTLVSIRAANGVNEGDGCLRLFFLPSTTTVFTFDQAVGETDKAISDGARMGSTFCYSLIFLRSKEREPLSLKRADP